MKKIIEYIYYGILCVALLTGVWYCQKTFFNIIDLRTQLYSLLRINVLLFDKVRNKEKSPTYEELKSITVFIGNVNQRIQEFTGVGTGTVIKIEDNTTYILTNRHLCSGKKNQGCIVFDEDNQIEAEIVNVGIKDVDLSLIKIPTIIRNKTGIVDIVDSTIQEKIYMVGNALGLMTYTYSEGFIANYENNTIITVLNVLPGHSGSPVVNKDLKMIGIVYAYLEGSGHAVLIDAETIKTFLDESNYDRNCNKTDIGCFNWFSHR